MTATKPKISVVLITLNAAAHLQECLDSVKWADEIVVLDSGSTDSTEAICALHGVRFTRSKDWPGFGPQRNCALALATGEWIFTIDADEICSPELRAEIPAATLNAAINVYEIPRLSSFCGHWMRHGGWWPDHVPRLFRRGTARYSEHLIHEALLAQGPRQRLRSHLLHYTYDTLEQALEKLNRYSTLAAQQAFREGRRANLVTAQVHALWAFVRTYLLRHGFLDGSAGWQLACYNAQTTYYKYLKLSYLARAQQDGGG